MSLVTHSAICNGLAEIAVKILTGVPTPKPSLSMWDRGPCPRRWYAMVTSAVARQHYRWSLRAQDAGLADLSQCDLNHWFKSRFKSIDFFFVKNRDFFPTVMERCVWCVYSEVDNVYRKWLVTWRGRRQLQWRHQRQCQQREATSHAHQLYPVADGRTGTGVPQQPLPGCLRARNAGQKTRSCRVPHPGLNSYDRHNVVPFFFTQPNPFHCFSDRTQANPTHLYNIKAYIYMYCKSINRGIARNLLRTEGTKEGSGDGSPPARSRGRAPLGV